MGETLGCHMQTIDLLGHDLVAVVVILLVMMVVGDPIFFICLGFCLVLRFNVYAYNFD